MEKKQQFKGFLTGLYLPEDGEAREVTDTRAFNVKPGRIARHCFGTLAYLHSPTQLSGVYTHTNPISPFEYRNSLL